MSLQSVGAAAVAQPPLPKMAFMSPTLFEIIGER